MRLVVTADDYGYCPRRNRGIIEAFTQGIVTGASLLVSGSYAKDAAELARLHHLPVGLHFNLTEGFPSAEIENLGTKEKKGADLLIDKDTGCFLGKFPVVSFLLGSDGTEEGLREYIVAEYKAQVAKFCELTGTPPKHFDGHNHVHVIPAVSTALVTVVTDVGVRIPADKEARLERYSQESERFLTKISDHAEKVRDAYCTGGKNVTTSRFIGLDLTGQHMTLSNLGLALCSIGSADTVELMVHPGYAATADDGGCGTAPDEFARSVDRELELKFLISPQVKLMLQEHQVEMVPWESIES